MRGELQNGAIRFSGYAAIFDALDRGGDIIRKGAFTESLGRLRRRDGSLGLPLLWQHDATAPIGAIEALEEDDRGLKITGRLFAPKGPAAAAYRTTYPNAHPNAHPNDGVAQGKLTGLSFGYRVQAANDPAPGVPRELLALDLVEISLVTAPMQPLARIHAVEPLLPP
jgi:uncharacterized protein